LRHRGERSLVEEASGLGLNDESMAKSFPKKKRPPATAPAVRTKEPTWPSWLPRVLLIVGVTLFIYWPALNGGFVWDDGWYVTTNPLMHGWIGLWKFWFQPGSWVEYYPLQETVQWVQWQLWGDNTLGYHLTNIALHVVNALLVWRLLGKFGLKLAWLGGLLFAVHPIQVESVAYICELKNTLSLPFFLLAMCHWIDYEEKKRSKDYFRAFGLFFVGMLCKITMAPFPFVIVLYAWWKRGRVEGKDFKAAAPFLVISLVLGFTTVWVGEIYRSVGHEQPEIIPIGGILSRIDGVGLITLVYLSRFFLPLDVLLVYPQWRVDPHSVIQYVPWLLFFGGAWYLWKKRQSWGRHVLLGLGFFLLYLAPFLGFVPVSYMSFTWVMDHLLYLPIIGLIGLVIAALGDVETRFPMDRPYLRGAFIIILAVMVLESRAFANLFINEETLWIYILQRNPHVWLAHHDLGSNLIDRGHYAEAVPHLEEVVRLNPNFSDGHYNLGLALYKIGRTAEAQSEYRQALKLNPKDEKTYINLADSMFQEGRSAEAIELYRRALTLVPDLPQLHYNLGNALLQAGNLPEATEQFGIAVKLDPSITQAHENFGTVLAQSGALPAAIQQFEAAIQINPSYVVARNNLGLALAQTGHIPEAIEQFQQVLQIDPDNASARQNLMKLQAYLLQAPPAK